MYTAEDNIDFKPIYYILDKLVGYSDYGCSKCIDIYV